MKRKLIVPTAVISTFVFASSAFAQAKGMANVAVEIDAAPASSIGLLISEAGVSQKLNTIVDATDRPGTYQVSFPYRKTSASSNAVATALIIGEDGSVGYSNTVSLKPGSVDNALLDTPACETVDMKRVKEVITTGQHSLIESLVRIREERRELLKGEVASLLSGEFLIRLRTLEKAFGLSHEGQISPDMSPMELNDHLTRLLHAIRTYHVHEDHRKIAEGSL